MRQADLLVFLALAPAALLGEQVGADSAHYRAGDLDASPSWSVGAPDLALGGPGGAGPEQFDQVGSIQLLADGAIALTDWGSAEVRIFESHGAHRVSVGRSPSESRGGAA